MYNVLFSIHIDSKEFRFYNVVSETKMFLLIIQKIFRSVPRVPRGKAAGPSGTGAICTTPWVKKALREVLDNEAWW